MSGVWVGNDWVSVTVKHESLPGIWCDSVIMDGKDKAGHSLKIEMTPEEALELSHTLTMALTKTRLMSAH